MVAKMQRHLLTKFLALTFLCYLASPLSKPRPLLCYLRKPAVLATRVAYPKCNKSRLSNLSCLGC